MSWLLVKHPAGEIGQLSAGTHGAGHQPILCSGWKATLEKPWPRIAPPRSRTASFQRPPARQALPCPCSRPPPSSLHPHRVRPPCRLDAGPTGALEHRHGGGFFFLCVSLFCYQSRIEKKKNSQWPCGACLRVCSMSAASLSSRRAEVVRRLCRRDAGVGRRFRRGVMAVAIVLPPAGNPVPSRAARGGGARGSGHPPDLPARARRGHRRRRRLPPSEGARPSTAMTPSVPQRPLPSRSDGSACSWGRVDGGRGG